MIKCDINDYINPHKIFEFIGLYILWGFYIYSRYISSLLNIKNIVRIILSILDNRKLETNSCYNLNFCYDFNIVIIKYSKIKIYPYQARWLKKSSTCLKKKYHQVAIQGGYKHAVKQIGNIYLIKLIIYIEKRMIMWFLMAVLSAFFAGLSSIFAKVWN